jgi:hypothetical protein
MVSNAPSLGVRLSLPIGVELEHGLQGMSWVYIRFGMDDFPDKRRKSAGNDDMGLFLKLFGEL